MRNRSRIARDQKQVLFVIQFYPMAIPYAMSLCPINFSCAITLCPKASSARRPKASECMRKPYDMTNTTNHNSRCWHATNLKTNIYIARTCGLVSAVSDPYCQLRSSIPKITGDRINLGRLRGGGIAGQNDEQDATAISAGTPNSQQLRAKRRFMILNSFSQDNLPDGDLPVAQRHSVPSDHANEQITTDISHVVHKEQVTDSPEIHTATSAISKVTIAQQERTQGNVAECVRPAPCPGLQSKDNDFATTIDDVGQSGHPQNKVETNPIIHTEEPMGP